MAANALFVDVSRGTGVAREVSRIEPNTPLGGLCCAISGCMRTADIPGLPLHDNTGRRPGQIFLSSARMGR
jgi:hypothetical protein